ncbi:MAG: hypothetical protein COU10_01165 [Candidatus Harrisonbacteria bacterium CG10_big_fil_rev_8_21_14_0_10_45_28]|uniref:Type 4 fimbrial biogenesis protein PilX N-terminal domain-containing protein n=1 Tax=Candidatus Harrisonbacteria bacterium CG10_big_fil_rev_8_21_14_0_10_45_28 TaxID=1974586 RepID=A0A2H0UNW6_9BACT|nr:MAG: hypothetical protein COU10_01165 [Candidatus Harrisonbacteria bacterium CG10_big_fil_rev_8_21_14_0_10_45_28]
MKNFLKNEKGTLTLQVLLIGFIGIITISGFVLWTDTFIKSVASGKDKSQAFAIAEAGVEYYRWHLAHDSTDFQDGTGTTGPYTHAYFDKNGNRLGEFELDITPPEDGSTIVVIKSTGRLDLAPSLEKIVQARMGMPSFAKYSVVANEDIRFGEGTEVYGQLHSNGGIRFDGEAYNIVTSAKETYNDPDHSGNAEFGVHTHLYPTDPLPPNSIPVREDVFKAGRAVGVPAVDFAGITQDLSELKTMAQDDGYYRGSSGNKNYGYEIVLKTNDTFDIYKVTKLVSMSWVCSWYGSRQKNWNSWSVKTKSLIQGNVPFPGNGIIFIEDDLWVSGKINTARITIAAGRFPFTANDNKSITVNNDLIYTNYDGRDVIALIAQSNFNVGYASEDDLRIDGAVIAQNGRVGRPYYNSSCGGSYIRSKITMFGMLASNERYGFAYTDGTGYQDRILMYDGNLLYSPPPYFPITGSQYEIITWDEIK